MDFYSRKFCCVKSAYWSYNLGFSDFILIDMSWCITTMKIPAVFSKDILVRGKPIRFSTTAMELNFF